MTDPRPCQRCGAPLPESGECPRCLLRLGLELPPRDPDGPPGAAESAPPSPPPAPRPPPPSLEDIARRFPQLEIKSLLGQGGMGVVYRARQPRLDREVALKVLPPELSSQPHFAERFLREARAMARLAHPNIVAVHDFGETDGMCWLMMELVDGVNLRQALKSGALAPEKALAVVPQMCDALQYAHDEGVVHRDIKPENVLLDRAGRVKIADFGLAKLVGAQDVSITRETQVFGTPHYMAPEQMEGARDVDHRADIFSLGVVFYEMLTGRLPVGRFDPPSRRVHVDVRLDEVVLHALEHEPERRYQHVSEVKTDIESVAAGREPAGAQSDARTARKHGPPSGFVGVWLEWPKKKRPGEADAPAGKPDTHHLRWGGRPGWRTLILLVASVLAWRVAGELTLKGGAGPFLAIALMLGMAVAVLMTAVSAVPALRAALVAEPARVRALRFGLATFAVLLGLLAVGYAVIEGWETGTTHYLSDSRDPVTWQQRFSREDVPVELQTPEELIFGTPHPSTREAWGLGVSMLLLFGAAAALRTRNPGWRASLGPILAVPAVLLAGLGLLAAGTEFSHSADGMPDLTKLLGTVPVDLGPVETGVALRSALGLEGYALIADIDPPRIVTEPGADGRVVTHLVPPPIEELLSFEPKAPWDRWSLEDGMPRRRRPHVAVRIRRDADDEHHCVVDWDCGWVRPVAGEAAAWKEWIERILHDAPRFTGSAAGG